jgi:thioester reductase-like protein
MDKHILVTGATGFVGINLVRKLLEQENVYLYLLVRDSGRVSATHRMVDILKTYYLDDRYQLLSKRINIISGDIAKEDLGLSKIAWRELSQKIDTIFHSAATIQFDLPLEEARNINVNGTERLLKFADQCHKNGVLNRLNYISTAYIAGKASNKFFESDINIGQEFANTYEKTKCEAEVLVRQYFEKGLPVTVYRPSVIAGNSLTGEITKGNFIYSMITQLSHSKYKEFICNDDSSLNFIPSDYFIDAMIYISEKENCVGKTFNIVNKNNSNIKELIQMLCQIINVDVPQFIPVNKQKNASKRTRMLLYIFMNYIEKSHMFDDFFTGNALRGTHIICPEINYDFLKKTTSYIQKSNVHSNIS